MGIERGAKRSSNVVDGRACERNACFGCCILAKPAEHVLGVILSILSPIRSGARDGPRLHIGRNDGQVSLVISLYSIDIAFLFTAVSHYLLDQSLIFLSTNVGLCILSDRTSKSPV